MGDSQILPSPVCNPNARKVVSFNNTIYQTTESFYSDNKEVGKEGITLSQTRRAWEEASRGSVYEDRERSYGDAPFYPAQLPAAEPHPTHDLEQELPADTIVSFFYIQLADQSTFFLLRVESTISLAIRTTSKISHPSTKAFWDLEITLSMTLLILLANTLIKILYRPPTRLIGLKSLMFSTVCFLGDQNQKSRIHIFDKSALIMKLLEKT